MSLFEIAFLTTAAFCTSALTAVVGAGGGTALIALMLQVLTPAAAIPVHGVVQFASNTTRVWLLWSHMSWPIIFRFIALMPIGVWIGLVAFQGLSTAAVQTLIGLFILVTLFTKQMRAWRDKEMPFWAFVPLGFVTGALNMVVGVIAPVLGVLIIRKNLTREAMVGTLGFFGFIGNLLKVAGFSLIGFSFVEYGLLMICMVPAAMIGTRVGRALLSGLNERYFLIAFRTVLVALALKLIVFDGLALWMT